MGRRQAARPKERKRESAATKQYREWSSFRENDFLARLSEQTCRFKSALSPGPLLKIAMVPRGEMGLLIVEIGYTSKSYVSSNRFITAIWVVLLKKIIGPIFVG
jgi:hypothetical protein